MLHLVTAHLDEPHVTAENQGNLNIEIFGADNFAFDAGENFASSIVSNNLVRIYDGKAMMEGRYFELDAGDYEDITVENGTQGQKRIDLIVARYVKDEETAIETISFEIIKGTPSATPVQPEYNDGSILSGDTVVDFPFYAVHINGLTIESVEQLFSIYDGVEGAMNEITPEMIDEWWGSTLESGDDLEY